MAILRSVQRVTSTPPGRRARRPAGTSSPRSRRAPPPERADVLEFLGLIWAVDHALSRTSRRMEATLGITAQQRLVLRIVGRFPGIPAGHVARLLHIHPGTLTGIVRRIERRGLIARRSDANDGRRALLGLTEEGRLLDVETPGTVEAAVQRTLENAPAEQIEAVREVLCSIARNLDPGAERADAKQAGRNLVRW